MNRISKVIDERGELVDLLAVRLLMRPVQKRCVLPEVILCNRLVGDQHKVLDDLRCNIALVRLDRNRDSLLIQNHLRLREIKVDRTALHALFPQNSRKRLHAQKHRNQLLILCDRCRVMVCKDLLHVGVGHPSIHADDRLRNLMVNDLPLGIYGHDTA